ncbi:MAG: alpha/beta hydrolase [Saprospiraceae bacterium]|nr:alpha/beta hydrolase [Saprospiraceae bacterium]
MKTILLSLALALPLFALGQQTDPFAAFSAQKKSVQLHTGITMKYVEAGNPLGTPVILLHGYTDSGRSFQFVLPALEKENPQLRILAPDLRGHGESSMPDSTRCSEHPETCFEPNDFAADIVALMDHLNIRKAHIVGHSMGSIVAQELALNHSGRVNSLVLIGTFVDGKKSAAVNDFLIGELIEKTIRTELEKRPGFHWPSDAWLLTPNDISAVTMPFLQNLWVVDPVAPEAFVQAILPETAHVPLGVWIGVIKALALVDNREALKTLKKPTLLLWATQDNAFPAEPDQQQVKEAFQIAAETHGTRVIYKTYGKKPLPTSGMQESDLGHNLHWGAPDEVAADIASFIQTGLPTPGLPHANPANIKQVLIGITNSNITTWGKNAALSK